MQDQNDNHGGRPPPAENGPKSPHQDALDESGPASPEPSHRVRPLSGEAKPASPRFDDGQAGSAPAPNKPTTAGGSPPAVPVHAAPDTNHIAGGNRRSNNASSHSPTHSDRSNGDRRSVPEVYGALDLGTNNCRLLLARPTRRGFRVVDAFSRIIRLGEGVSQSGRLSDAAMNRTMDALRVCASKLARSRVERARLVATEACRVASNGEEFLCRVRDRLGLDIELLSREAEAELAVSGCASLIDGNVDYVLVFDIGGGSSELIWLDLTRRPQPGRQTVERAEAQACMAAWTSLPVGVVTLAERFGGRHVTPELFEAKVKYVTDLLVPFEAEHGFRKRVAANPAHLLGTSGTVTTVAGIEMGLPRYDRNKVDGCWLTVESAQAVTHSLLHRTYEERIAEPCIGRDRADLVLAGCAILEALIRMWPCERLRVADRGLREGILSTLMSEDGVFRSRRRRSGRRRGG